MKRIIIIGGGFAGVHTAKSIVDKIDAEIVMISETNYFLFTPLLHEVSVGTVNRHNIVEPIRDIIKSKNFWFYRSRAEKIDLDKKQVYFNGTKLNYDYLVIAIGSKTNYYGVKGAEKHAMSLKTLRDSIDIRDNIIDSLESANLSKTKKDMERHLNFVVIGAGPTGVELSGDMADLIHENIETRYKYLKNQPWNLYLIQAGPVILPICDKVSQDKAMSILKSKKVDVMLDSSVTEVGKDYVVINSKKRIDTTTIIWSGGIKPNDIETIPKIQDKNGYFVVDDYLRVVGYNEVFSLGDCSIIENGRVPALAQVALKQGKLVGENIVKMIKGEDIKKFNFRNNGIVVSVGEKKAVAEINATKEKKFFLSGFFAWVMKRHIYLMNIPGIQNKIRVGIEWFLGLFFDRDTSEI